MKKLLFFTMLAVGLSGLNAQTIPVNIQTHASLSAPLPGTPVWIYFYNKGSLVHSDHGFSDSSSYAIFSTTISTSLVYDSAVSFAIDCNGNKVRGVASPVLSNPFNIEDTIYLSCSISQSGCQASVATQQSTSQPLTINFSDNSIKSPIPNRKISGYIFFGDNDSSQVPENFSHTYPAPGTYNIEYRYSEFDSISGGNYFCESRFYDTIVVSATMPIACNATYSVDTVNSGNGTALIYNKSTPAVNNPAYSMTYHWDFGDGDTSNQPFPVHNYANPGKYGVCLSITADSSGVTCTSTFCDTLGIDSLGNLLYKSTSTGFTLQVLNPGIGLIESALTGFDVYPNPVKDLLTIEVSEALTKNLTYILTDVKGAALRSGDWSPAELKGTLHLDVSGLQPGIYLLNLKNGNGASAHFKVIKQ